MVFEDGYHQRSNKQNDTDYDKQDQETVQSAKHSPSNYADLNPIPESTD